MSGALRLVAPAARDTHAIGRAVSALLRPGDVVALSGDLGAGKTAFVQGAAEGLGVTEPVTSPTFTLIREYEGRIHVYHLDVYRLDRVQDVLDLGFEELLDQEGVVFIEWGDAVAALLPQDHLRVDLEIEPEGERRLVTVAAPDGSWADRWQALNQAVIGWRAEPEEPPAAAGGSREG